MKRKKAPKFTPPLPSSFSPSRPYTSLFPHTLPITGITATAFCLSTCLRSHYLQPMWLSSQEPE